MVNIHTNTKKFTPGKESMNTPVCKKDPVFWKGQDFTGVFIVASWADGGYGAGSFSFYKKH